MQVKTLKFFAVLMLCTLLSGCIGKPEPPKIDVPKEEKKAASSSEPAEAGNEAENKENEKYAIILKENFKALSGNYSYGLHMYDTDYRSEYGEGRFKSASVIKLFVMDYVYSLVSKGEISLDDVIGSRSVSSLIESMITVSDNNSTNTLIDRFTMDKINEHIRASGYTDTVLARRMLDTAAAAAGRENYTSAKDVMKLLDKLYAQKDTFPQSEMLAVMKRQQIATKLRRDMPSGIEMASKTGELSDTENDVGIVFTPHGDYAIVCLTQNCSSSQARSAMALSCRAIYDELMK